MCCGVYGVRLKKEEWKLIGKLWPGAVIERNRGVYLSKIGGRCVFQRGQLCFLQPLGLKPLACKLWPFVVFTVPISEWETEGWESLFILGEREYFIYVDTACKGINQGSLEKLEKVLAEVVEIHNNPWVEQRLTTWLCKVLSVGHNIQDLNDEIIIRTVNRSPFASLPCLRSGTSR